MNIKNILLLPLIIFLISCESLNKNPNKYPVELQLGESEHYPLKVKEFSREKIILHGPGDVSVGYNLSSESNQVAVTFFDYKPEVAFDDLYKKEKEVIGKVKQNVEVLNESGNTFAKNAKKFPYKKMSFTASDNFANQMQKVYSELFLIKVDDKFIKVRMTTPYNQKTQASKLTADLINKINWTPN